MSDSVLIKCFSIAKGFGFIVNENGTQDIFVHYSSIVSEGYRTLKSGQIVNFDIKKGRRVYMQKMLFQLDITINAEKDINVW